MTSYCTTSDVICAKNAHWIPIEVIFIAFDRKFPKFRMEGKWLGHFSEIPTENWGVRFEVVLSFQLVRTKQNVAYH